MSSVPYGSRAGSRAGASASGTLRVPAREDLATMSSADLLAAGYQTWRKLCQILFTYSEQVCIALLMCPRLVFL